MSNLRSNIALGLSGMALLIATYAALTQSTSSVQSASLPDGKELAELKEQMLAYQRTLARMDAARNYERTTAAEIVRNSKTEQAMEPVNAEIISFKSPDGLRVKTGENGAVSVINTDKRLTGKIMTVKAMRTNGTEENITIIVPAPGN